MDKLEPTTVTTFEIDTSDTNCSHMVIVKGGDLHGFMRDVGLPINDVLLDDLPKKIAFYLDRQDQTARARVDAHDEYRQALVFYPGNSIPTHFSVVLQNIIGALQKARA